MNGNINHNNIRFDFSQAKNLFGIITDIEAIIQLPRLQEAIYRKIEEIGSNDHFAVMLTHINEPSMIIQCLNILLHYCNVKHVYIPFSLEMEYDHKWTNLKQNIANALNGEMTDDMEISLSSVDERFEHLRQVSNSGVDDDYSGNNGNRRDKKKFSDLKIKFERFPASLYASSKKYDVFRKLIKMGKLRGSIVWDEADQRKEWENPDVVRQENDDANENINGNDNVFVDGDDQKEAQENELLDSQAAGGLDDDDSQTYGGF